MSEAINGLIQDMENQSNQFAEVHGMHNPVYWDNSSLLDGQQEKDHCLMQLRAEKQPVRFDIANLIYWGYEDKYWLTAPTFNTSAQVP